MAKLTLGGRELEVPPLLMGTLRKRVRPAREVLEREIDAASAEGKTRSQTEDEVHDAIARFLLPYLDGIAGVTVEWLSDALPVDVGQAFAVIAQVRTAAGERLVPPGEAKGQ